ncbi:G2/M phase-specific E3 ubiquitin-protein ligase-like [Ylistrum balloti]|uniref:G2/M phase-specific E3 ubiquitin-protein ligase-like n=1 Tax=Ylistrum balloti TaxID=509963 RepID=UPI00290599C5|nr:G2/M phase-specific E3 ubiquitin-protein ligase-like [Ylistrum balloti]
MCPVCREQFPVDILPVHASSCGVGKDPNLNLPDQLSKIAQELKRHEKPWSVKVVRRLFEETALEQLEDGDEDDWNKPISIQFLGEEGIDAGGLSREFFSLLFKTSKVFEENTFSVNPQLLVKKQYCLIGKAVAKAIVSGHPGPRCLNQHVTNYMLLKQEADFSMVKIKEIQRCCQCYKRDVVSNRSFTSQQQSCIATMSLLAVLVMIGEATLETIGNVYNEHISMFEATGYTKILTLDNKDETIKALKAFYLLYRPMASINQFMEGLKLHGILQKLQEHPKDACLFFNESSYPTADFFKPVYSSVTEEKEEMIVYNWGKYLKNIEKGRISTPWLSMDTGVEDIVELNMGHLCQALLGCPKLLTSMNSGSIQFDHKSSNLPTVNTCAPSITFSKTEELQNDCTFQEVLQNVIVGAYGFGIA